MKDIMEVSYNELFFELPINRAVKIDTTCKCRKEKTDICSEGYRTYMEEYITEASDGYMRLIDFIQKETMGVYGLCPCCQKPINFTVTSKQRLPEDVCKKQVQYYNDMFGDEEIAWMPEAADVMEERIKQLIISSQFIDKYMYCSICENTYRVSFALEYNEKQKCILLIKIGQYPSLHEFSNKDLSALDKILKKFKIKTDYQSAIRMHTDDYNIAAYVYLRRVLENIVVSKYNTNKSEVDEGLDVQKDLEIVEKTKIVSDEAQKKEIKEKIMRKYAGGFEYLDFSEKLKALKEYVPEFLLENPAIYSIASAGIHSLNEEKCREYYDFLKQAIDIILHEEEAKRKKEELIKRTQKGIEKAVSEIKKI